MATERLSMRTTREILRQKWVLKKSHREVAQRTGQSPGAVGGAVRRATIAGLDWAVVEKATAITVDPSATPLTSPLFGPSSATSATAGRALDQTERSDTPWTVPSLRDATAACRTVNPTATVGLGGARARPVTRGRPSTPSDGFPQVHAAQTRT